LIINLQIKYKWKIPKRRIQLNAEFDNSNSKSIKNQYVNLKPKSKEIFEMSDMLIMDSSIQVFILIFDIIIVLILNFKYIFVHF